MTTGDIDASDLDKLNEALRKLTGPLLDKFKQRATYYVSIAIKAVMQPYPQGHHLPVIWASEKQRRWYFAMRREAGLDPKYTRGSDPMSQRMQASWAIRRHPTSAVLGNRATYAPYVQSREFQTAQHAASNWTTDEQAAEKVIANGMMKKIVDAHVKTIVREAFGKLYGG